MQVKHRVKNFGAETLLCNILSRTPGELYIYWSLKNRGKAIHKVTKVEKETEDFQDEIEGSKASDTARRCEHLVLWEWQKASPQSSKICGRGAVASSHYQSRNITARNETLTEAVMLRTADTLFPLPSSCDVNMKPETFVEGNWFVEQASYGYQLRTSVFAHLRF